MLRINSLIRSIFLYFKLLPYFDWKYEDSRLKCLDSSEVQVVSCQLGVVAWAGNSDRRRESRSRDTHPTCIIERAFIQLCRLKGLCVGALCI